MSLRRFSSARRSAIGRSVSSPTLCASAASASFPRKGSLVAGPITERTAEAVHCRVGHLHPSQQHLHRHAGKRLALPLAREHEIADLGIVQPAQQGHGLLGQGDGVTQYQPSFFRQEQARRACRNRSRANGRLALRRIRDASSIVNSSARADIASEARTSTMNAGTFSNGIAAIWPRVSFRRLGRMFFR